MSTLLSATGNMPSEYHDPISPSNPAVPRLGPGPPDFHSENTSCPNAADHGTPPQAMITSASIKIGEGKIFEALVGMPPVLNKLETRKHFPANSNQIVQEQ
jgi:hypothetical protein